MQTRITKMLGIEYPILCGGMMVLAKPRLCAAISEAGGLGNLTAANYANKDKIREAIKEVRSMTDKPFWMNVTMLPHFRISEKRYMEIFDVCIEEKVAAVEIAGSPLDRFLKGTYIDKLKIAGVKMIHKLGSVRHALHCEKVGYDAVLAAGVEEGGHPLNDNVATSILTPRIAESVSIPIVTTGGIADGRGLASALCLGADGVMMATRFICTDECEVHPNIQEEIIRRQEYETVLYGNSIGLQGRAIKNETIKKIIEIENGNGNTKDIFPLLAGSLSPKIWKHGDVNAGSINVGQSIGLVHDLVPVKILIDRMVKEARAILEKASVQVQ